MNKFMYSNFEDTTIDLDGKHFENCNFKNCVIRFNGNALFTLIGCNFHTCKWTLDGPASTTIQFLRMMYKDMGDFGKQMVDATFENIKK